MMVTLGKKVLFILDNIDKLLLDSQDGEYGFLDQLDELVDSIPTLRVLMSGTNYSDQD
jgi:hypothetical protein